MELRQLRCFVAVAEEQHFGRAAARLGIGQPAASQLIARLERELRIALFARTSRRVALTPPGAEFLGHARSVLAAADAATAAAQRLSRSPRRLLVVGTCTGLGDRVGSILAALAESDPALEVRLHAIAGRERGHRVASGQVAAAFTHDVRPHKKGYGPRRCGWTRCGSRCRPRIRWPASGSCAWPISPSCRCGWSPGGPIRPCTTW